jgi:phytoene desaturase
MLLLKVVMKQKKVIIIGAGVGGLASAIRLQSQGYHVTLVEKNDRVGGRMYRLEDQGFKFDVGPTIVMMPDVYKELFTYSGANPDAYLSMQLLDPLYQLHYHDGTTLTMSSNLTKLMETLESFSPDEAQRYLAYLADIYKRYTIANDGFIDRGFLRLRDILNWKVIRNTFRLRTFNSAYKSISKFVKNEKLRQALSFQTLYIGVSPFEGPSIYTIISMIEILYGIWYIRGGMYAMAEAMQKRFLELGGTIRLSTPVSSILVEQKKAIGVRLDHEDLVGDIVVCNADFPNAVRNLIPTEHRGKYTEKKFKKMQYSSSAFILYLGLKKKYPTTVHQIRYAKDFKKNIEDLFAPRMPNDPSFYLYSPTQIDPTLAPEGKEILYMLVPVPNREHPSFTWDTSMRQSFRNDMMARLQAIPGFEDILDHIEVEHVYTPKTWEDTFNLIHGATFGLKPILFQSNFFRPQANAIKVNHLYFVGSSVHPGAGIPIVLKSAKIVTDIILKEHPIV